MPKPPGTRTEKRDFGCAAISCLLLTRINWATNAVTRQGSRFERWHGGIMGPGHIRRADERQDFGEFVWKFRPRVSPTHNHIISPTHTSIPPHSQATWVANSRRKRTSPQYRGADR